MRLMTGVLVAVAASAVALSGPTAAKPKIKTKYAYYTISGTSARNLYQQMISRGPHVGGERALAATTMKTRQTGELGGKSTCQVKNYRLSLDFTIRLPKVRNETALSPRLRKNWRAFYKFIRRHEQRHRAIWIGCTTSIERQVRKLRAKDCRQLDTIVTGYIKKASKACEKKHSVFDTAEQKRLARHPLVAAAKRVRRKTNKTASRTKAASAKTIKAFSRGRAADDF